MSQDGQNSVTTVEYKTKIDAKFCKGFDKHGHVFDYLLEKKSTWGYFVKLLVIQKNVYRYFETSLWKLGTSWQY